MDAIVLRRHGWRGVSRNDQTLHYGMSRQVAATGSLSSRPLERGGTSRSHVKRDASFQALSVKSLADARQLLINQLRSRYRHTPHQVIVVFDGDGVSEQNIQDHRVRIIYSRAGETADSVIARLAVVAQTAGRKVELYSDDNEVKQSVVQQGGRVGSTNQLTPKSARKPPSF